MTKLGQKLAAAVIVVFTIAPVVLLWVALTLSEEESFSGCIGNLRCRLAFGFQVRLADKPIGATLSTPPQDLEVTISLFANSLSLGDCMPT